MAAENVARFAVANGYDSDALLRLPIGISLPILASLYHCRLAPPTSLALTKELYTLIGRPDVALNSGASEVRSMINLEKSCEEKTSRYVATHT